MGAIFSPRNQWSAKIVIFIIYYH